MPVLSVKAKPTKYRRSISIAATVVGLSLVACGEPARDASVSESELSNQGPDQATDGSESRSADFMTREEVAIIEEMAVDPKSAGDELAFEALEATEVTEVITAMTEPLFSVTKKLPLKGHVDQAVANTVGRFGASCVEVHRTPGLNALDSTVTFTYTDCSGPLKLVSFSGTSTTTFVMDLIQRSVSVTTEDNLVIHKDGMDIPLVSSRSGTLTTDGVEVDLNYTGLTGEPRHIAGLLELAPSSSGCVVASLGASERVTDSGFAISNLELCYDGNICVGGVELNVLGLGVTLSFDTGTLSFRRRNQAPVEIPLPVSAPVCVQAF